MQTGCQVTSGQVATWHPVLATNPQTKPANMDRESQRCTLGLHICTGNVFAESAGNGCYRVRIHDCHIT